VDPLTLLAAANAAVAAVKAGCKLYKDIKGAAGDVSDVLKDLKEQYNKIVDPTPQQKMQYNAEVQRVQEIAKADPNDVFTDIGTQLGALMDTHDEIAKLLLKEQLEAKVVYKGEDSIGKRALRRILINSRLDAIWAEVRETMVYKAPPELGALWSKFDEMRQEIIAEQEVAHAEELRLAQIATWRRRKRIAEIRAKAAWVSAVVFVVIWAVGLLWLTTKSMTQRMYLGH
jgi:hypothetical protein